MKASCEAEEVPLKEKGEGFAMSDRKIKQIDIPAGAPVWMTKEIVEQTLRVWQPYYAHPLTVTDAIDIMQAAAGLFKALANEDRCHEAVCRAR
jgi:hypothetical protein